MVKLIGNNLSLQMANYSYAIEDRLKELAPEQKAAQRQTLAGPVLDDLKTWLQANASRLPKDSLTAKAITYTLNQWDNLIGYCEDGRLHISKAQLGTEGLFINQFAFPWPTFLKLPWFNAVFLFDLLSEPVVAHWLAIVSGNPDFR